MIGLLVGRHRTSWRACYVETITKCYTLLLLIVLIPLVLLLRFRKRVNGSELSTYFFFWENKTVCTVREIVGCCRCLLLLHLGRVQYPSATFLPTPMLLFFSSAVRHSETRPFLPTAKGRQKGKTETKKSKKNVHPCWRGQKSNSWCYYITIL